MNKKQIIISLILIIVLVLIIVVFSNKKTASEMATQNIPDANILAIRSFMSQPNLEFQYERTGRPTNFTVGKWENPSVAEGKMNGVPEYDRSVAFYTQTNIDKNCQVYTYEIDVRNHQIVQVQLVGNLPIGTELQNDQGQCQKTNGKTITQAEAKEIAIDYLKRNISNYEQIKDQFTYDGTSGIYTWLYEDKSFKLPAGAVSDPYPYPTVRVIITKGGYLMNYINTTGLFK